MSPSNGLHRRTPSNDSMDSVNGSKTTPQSAEKRGGRKKTPNKQEHGEVDIEMNDDSKNAKRPMLKAKLSEIDLGDAIADKNNHDERGGLGGVALKAVSACLLYSFCSVSMILTNKSLASRCVIEWTQDSRSC